MKFHPFRKAEGGKKSVNVQTNFAAEFLNGPQQVPVHIFLVPLNACKDEVWLNFIRF
jgi:hypothetical protein